MKYADFEAWFEGNKHLMPAGFAERLKKSSQHLEFICTWKEYEALIIPKLRALLAQQYPELIGAESFEPHIKQNIEHRIFELIEEMWKINEWNLQGAKPQDVLTTLYPVIMKSKEGWKSPLFLQTLEDLLKDAPYDRMPREEVIENLNQRNEERWESFRHWEKLYQDFIDVMQPDLLALLPNLLNIDADWWDVYVFFLRFQCNTWIDYNNSFSFLAEQGLTAEWLNKPREELHEYLDKMELERSKKGTENEEDKND
jgi:hypothetical protein